MQLTFYGVNIFEWVVLLWTFATVPLYLLVLTVVIRHRKDAPFNGSFFKLCLSEGVADLFMIFVGHPLLLFRLWGWVDWGPLFYHETLGWLFQKGYYVFSWIFAAPQISGIFFLCFNRYQSIMYHEKPDWSNQKVLLCVLLQWSTGIVAATSYIPQKNFTVEGVNNSAGVLIYHARPPKEFHAAFLLCISIYIYSTVLTIAWLYLKMFAKMRKHNTERQHSNPRAAVKKTEWRLALMGFALFIVLLFYGLFFGAYGFAAKSGNATAKHLTNILVYNTIPCLSMINPYLLVIFNKKTRMKLFKMIGLKSYAVAPSTGANSLSNKAK